MGVWIETSSVIPSITVDWVTPCVGVWIETISTSLEQLTNLSHPAWVCGLKPALPCLYTPVYMSHPAWVCGLKLLVLGFISLWKVTPCVGVWIETCETVQLLEQLRVTPCVGVWIETPQAMISRGLNPSHPAWVCGLKRWTAKRIRAIEGHTLRGCVDWNSLVIGRLLFLVVTPCVGVWIETFKSRKIS